MKNSYCLKITISERPQIPSATYLVVPNPTWNSGRHAGDRRHCLGGDRWPSIAFLTKAKKVKESEKVAEVVTELTFHYPMRISMTADKSGTNAMQKSMYNPIPKVKMLLMMVEMDPRLTVIASDRKSTLIIGKDKFLITEMAFKKFFSCKWETQGKQQNQIWLGCLINSNRTLNNIKHAVKPNQLIMWLTHKKVFLDADTLGIGKPKPLDIWHIFIHVSSITPIQKSS